MMYLQGLFLCCLLNYVGLIEFSNGQCADGETELRLEMSITSGSGVNIELFDSRRNVEYLDDFVGGATSYTREDLCVASGSCYYIASDNFGSQETFIVYEIDDSTSTETQILNDVAPYITVADLSMFCLTDANYVAPNTDCSGGEAEVTINVQDIRWPSEIGWFVFDADNDYQEVWYNSEIYSTSVDSQTACLPSGNYEFLLLNAHSHGLIPGYYEILVNGEQVLYKDSNFAGYTVFATFVIGMFNFVQIKLKLQIENNNLFFCCRIVLRFVCVTRHGRVLWLLFGLMLFNL